VAEEIQKGYLFNSRVVRFSKVAVAKPLNAAKIYDRSNDDKLKYLQSPVTSFNFRDEILSKSSVLIWNQQLGCCSSNRWPAHHNSQCEGTSIGGKAFPSLCRITKEGQVLVGELLRGSQSPIQKGHSPGNQAQDGHGL